MNTLTKRLIKWAVAVALLLTIPLVLTILGSGVDGDGWHWTFSDFVFMGGLLFGAALAYELVSRKINNSNYRNAVGVGAVTGVLLLWVNAAVGIIGDGPINMLYVLVILTGLIGAAISRLKPLGMSYTLFTMAVLQMLIPVIALMVGTQSFSPGVLQVFALNGVYALLWLYSALLFKRAALNQ